MFAVEIYAAVRRRVLDHCQFLIIASSGAAQSEAFTAYSRRWDIEISQPHYGSRESLSLAAA